MARWAGQLGMSQASRCDRLQAGVCYFHVSWPNSRQSCGQDVADVSSGHTQKCVGAVTVIRKTRQVKDLLNDYYTIEHPLTQRRAFWMLPHADIPPVD